MAEQQQSIAGIAGSASPAEPSSSAVDPAAIYRRVAEAADEKLRFGKALSREEHKAVREVAILAARDTHWADRHELAADLGWSPKQAEHRVAEARAAGVEIHAHSPIPKVPLLRWWVEVLESAPADSGAATARTDLATEEKRETVRKLRIQNDHREGIYIAEAESTAADAIAQLAGALKRAICYELPPAVVADLELDLADAEHRIRTLAKEALRSLADAGGYLEDLRADPTTEPSSDDGPAEDSP